MRGSAAPAGDALDLLPDKPFHDPRQVLVQPGLQHRAQHLLHEILHRTLLCRHKQSAKLIERPRNGGIRLRRKQRFWTRRVARRRGGTGAGCSIGGSAPGTEDVRAPCTGRAAAMGRSCQRSGCGKGWVRDASGGRASSGSGATSASGGVTSPDPSSSAMMRRIEARISSIVDSAGFGFADILTTPSGEFWMRLPPARRESPHPDPSAPSMTSPAPGKSHRRGR